MSFIKDNYKTLEKKTEEDTRKYNGHVHGSIKYCGERQTLTNGAGRNWITATSRRLRINLCLILLKNQHEMHQRVICKT